MSYSYPNPYNQYEEIAKMIDTIESAFSSHKKIFRMIDDETQGNNNRVVLHKLMELISSLDNICESFVNYINRATNFDSQLIYYREVLIHVLTSYLEHLQTSGNKINEVFPMTWPEDDFYSKEINRVNRLISIARSKN